MSQPIPYGRQDVDEDDIRAVVEVLRSAWLTQGPAVPSFENSVAGYCGTGHAVAMNSATSALHAACLALGVGKGDRVWTSPITFVASANCALYCGAQVDFVDIDSTTCNLSVECLEEKLIQAEKAGCLPKVVIPVHLCGQSCDMAGIYSLSQRYGFKIIEDASHAIGGKYRDEPIGCCRYSDIVVFSFHPVKIITSGEGGMALTNDERLAKRMRLLRSHGITSDAADMLPQASHELWGYQQTMLGFNYRMSDIHAALGSSQMRRLDAFVAKRHAIAKTYERRLKGLPVIIPCQPPSNYSSYHLYVIRLNLSEAAKTQREVFDAMRAAGVGVNLHYIPVYRQPYYAAQGFNAGHCPEAERYYAEAITLPIFPGLTADAQDEITKALCNALDQ